MEIIAEIGDISHPEPHYPPRHITPEDVATRSGDVAKGFRGEGYYREIDFLPSGYLLRCIDEGTSVGGEH